jgi:hypothetical protein
MQVNGAFDIWRRCRTTLHGGDARYVVIAVLQSGSTAERFRATMPDNSDSRDF